MSFTTETRTINDIFQRTVQYQVPRYQRNYVWKEINWKELLVDIKFTVQNNESMPWSHFLGTIVLNKVDTQDGVDRYEIIDGQQRLTTIYVLLIALYRQLCLLDIDESRNRAKYIHTTFLMSMTNQSKSITVVKNDDYDKDIQELVDYSKKGKKISKNNNYYKLYTYFTNEFKDYNYIDMTRFLDKLLTVNIVEIVSGQEEEIYNIFEVLNARGQKLKQIELLKNHVMKYIQPRNDEFIDSAKDSWRKIEQNVSKLSNADNLIVHFAKCYLKKQAENSNSVYRLIKEEVEINELSNFLEELVEFSQVYQEISDKQSKDEVIEYFNIKRNQQIRSLISAIYLLQQKEVIDENTKNEALSSLRNFFFQFNVTQQTSNKTDKIVSDISYKAYHCQYEVEFKIIFSSFLNKLKDFLETEKVREMFYLNNSFKYSNKDESLSRNRRLVKYTLKSLYNNYQRDTQIVPDDLTIEHLQSDDGHTDNSLLSNLTLTSADINAQELQNKPIIDKVNILSEQSNIKANQELKKYINSDMQNFDFEQRKKDILNDLLGIVFVVNPNIFHISRSDIDSYLSLEDRLKGDDELLKLLKQYGKQFLTKLKRDPNLIEQKQRYYKRFINKK